MKTIAVVVGLALMIATLIMMGLVRSGGALKPAGVIKVTEVGADPSLIGNYVATRLFPELHGAKAVIWYTDDQQGLPAQIPWLTHANYKAPEKPVVLDLWTNPSAECQGPCWYLQPLGKELRADLARQVQDERVVEIFVRYFDRNEEVSDLCEHQKILDGDCLRAVSAREVKRKLKTPAPHFFMQRYLESRFYLFIERPLAN
ncbi:MAG: hypothetical protein KF681_00015 [Bdellovibrionaceae bacterium]|nr:hypothetical protein [Pseudobdellovibrionaceae bacterium]